MPEIPIRDAAFDAIAQALTDAALVIRDYPVRVERNRDADVDDDARPLLVVMDGDMDAEQGTSLEALYIGRVQVIGYLGPPTAETMAEVMAQSNELHARAVRALIRPGGLEALPRALPLGDGLTEIDLREESFRVEVAALLEADAPLATFVLALSFELRAPWGNPFITIP